MEMVEQFEQLDSLVTLPATVLYARAIGFLMDIQSLEMLIKPEEIDYERINQDTYLVPLSEIERLKFQVQEANIN